MLVASVHVLYSMLQYNSA